MYNDWLFNPVMYNDWPFKKVTPYKNSFYCTRKALAKGKSKAL